MLGFNRYNKNLNYIRLIQRRSTDRSCINNRFPGGSLDKIKNCTGVNELKDNWTIGNVTYTYVSNKEGKQIKGTFDTYDNSGFYVDLPIANPPNFYKMIDSLENVGWIDDQTFSVLLVINFYNINIDLFIILRILYEDSGNSLNSTPDFGLIDITPVSDPFLIISIIFSIFCLISMVIALKKKNVKNNNEDRIFVKKGFWMKVGSVFTDSWEYMNKNYRAPNFFESISKIIYFK